MYPTKLDNIDIQTEVSSQFGFKKVNLTMQRDISSKITNIWTKNTTSDSGNVVWLQNFHEDLLLLSFSKKNFLQQQRQLDQLLLPPSRDISFFKKMYWEENHFT